MIPTSFRPAVHRLSVLLAVSVASLSLAACSKFPSPGAASPPLTKNGAGALAKCQQAVTKAQASFAQTKTSALQKCINDVLKITIPFDNGVTTQPDYDAAKVKIADKCASGYAKITAASTKFVDAIMKACGPVEDLLFGTYDGLRWQAALGGAGGTDLETFAGGICTLTESAVDAQLFLAAPRMIELLDSLGPDFVVETDVASGAGFPNVPLDSRCPPIETLGSIPNPLPTP
jgi:hypothetical protein